MHVLLDYWHVLAKITNDNGSLLADQVFTYHLEQPFVLPSLLFWADAAWFGGDNRVLTVLTVILMAGVVLLLRSMLPPAMSPALKAVLTGGFSWLFFSSHAMELWLQATNGISWVPAVFFCVLAIACAHRGLLWAAIAAAALGCLSFGAALPIWFALALVFLLRGESRARVLIPAAIGVVVIGAWFLTKPSDRQSLASAAFDPDGRISVLAAAIGGLWSANLAIIAVIAGGATLAMLFLLIGRSFINRIEDADRSTMDASWAGVAVYSFALAGMLALGRTTGQIPGGNVGLISRYVLIAALATSALLALAVMHRPHWPLRHVATIIITVSLVTHAIGGGKADNVRRDYAPLNLAAIALRVDSPTVLDTLHIQRGASQAARALGAYPFNDSFTLACHGPELGDQLDTRAAIELSSTHPTGGAVGAVDSPTLTGDTLITGWAAIDGAPPDCILITDPNDTVIGGGLTGLPNGTATTMTRPDGTAWQAVAPPGATISAVLAAHAGRLYKLQPTR
ncbi:DUF2079 domain-containing protein [Amycolatopsis umgeniensis]|uniref:Uncharacterized protein n=1 Tax=Amycolatopsis umgeniensis TaxID=336628 RepID=A0A841BEP4_9PSEU|nr:DUF2079 domain-containing protein [Amycolatopsis umgeniensis]MBB5857213.1 hypothetical protein [Amycolatopsis umgeniensis]